MVDWLQDFNQDNSRKEDVVDNSGMSMSFALLLLASFLAAGLICAYVYKTSSASTVQNPSFQQPYLDQLRRRRNNQIPSHPSSNGLENIKAAQKKIWERTKWNTDIVTLMSIIENHNLVVTQKGYPKSDYIYINEDWTIDKMPKYVNLTQEDKKFLRRYIKN